MINKKILITGANRGLGRGISEKLANEGYSLILHSRNPDALEGLLSKLENRAQHEICSADFRDSDSLKRFTSEIRRKYQKDLYAVINNAGIALDKAIVYQPEKEIDAMLQVNLKAPIMIGKMAMKIFLLKKEGVIINMTSCVGESGNAFQSVYAATKAGLNTVTKSWAKEAGMLLGENNIRVVSVSPGFIQTGMTDRLSEEIKNEYKLSIPAGRFGEPNDVANAIAFLLSKNASYINGTEVKINGGII